MAAQLNQSLLRGLEVLRVLARLGRPVGSRELSRQLNDNHTRINRLLCTLAESGVAEQDDQLRYYLGAGFHVLAAQCLGGSPLLQAAFPVLKGLIDQGYRTALGVLWRGAVSYLYHAGPDLDFSGGFAGHEAYPVADSSIGEVVEAFADVADPVTSQTTRSMIRKQGYALLRKGTDRESLAMPIYRHGRVAAGMALIGQSEIGVEGRVEILELAVAEISKNMEENACISK